MQEQFAARKNNSHQHFNALESYTGTIDLQL